MFLRVGICLKVVDSIWNPMKKGEETKKKHQRAEDCLILPTLVSSSPPRGNILECGVVQSVFYGGTGDMGS